MKITREKILSQIVVVIFTLVLVLVMLPAMAWAETDPVTGLAYTVTEGKATITGFTMPDSFDGNLVIPSTLGGATVTSIGEKAFQFCGYMTDSINSITIPEGVTSIGDFAFQACHAGSIIIPSSVTSIGMYAFESCTFTGIAIPEGVTSIGMYAFQYSAIISITIPGSMTSIGPNAFNDCTALECVIISPGVTKLDQFIFSNCANLTSVTIPVSVTDINYNTIFECTNVTIHGSAGSYAESYAENRKINFASDGTYAVVFDKNGAETEAVPSRMSVAGGDTIGTLPAPPTREQFRFAGWNTKANGSGTTITADTEINEPLHVYAQWTVDTPADFNNNDFQKLLAFALQGENTTKLGWNLTQPGTWDGITWNDAAEKRVTAIACQGSSSTPKNLTGSLGLSGCTALETLNCSYNNLDSLDVAGCTSLKYLDCSGSNLSSLDISSCAALEELNCSYSGLETLDVSGLTALTELSCYANDLTSLNVTNCDALITLWCEENNLTDLDVSSCTALVELDCSDNALTSLDLSGCEHLADLYCYTNELTSLDITGCSALTYLDCEGNAALELIWGLNQVKDNTGIEIYLDLDKSLAALVEKELAVLTVDGQIAALPAVSELTLAEEGLVSAAEEAYNGLSPVQKTFVTNYDKLVAAKNKIIKLKAPATYTLTITAGTGGSITGGSSGNYAAGTIIPITATAASGYTFNKWTSGGGGTFDNANRASTTFTMPAGAATITAGFTYNGGDDSGGSDESDTFVSAPTPIPTHNNINIAGNNLGVNVNSEAGSAMIDLGNLAGDVFNSEETTVVNVPAIAGVNSYTLGLPAASLSDAERAGTLTFATETGSITIPNNMLAGLAEAAGKQAAVTIGQGDRSTLPTSVQAALGERPLVQLSLTVDGTQTAWHNPEAPVTVTIPYTPTAAELADPEHIVVWYIDGSYVTSVPTGRYDIATGTVTFTTTHFSHYAVAYVQKTFGDLGSAEWARKSIEVIASKGIINGTGANTYSPAASVTRADYLILLVKTLGLTADFTDNFDDVQPGAYYYETLGIAKKLGLAAGIGANCFNPEKNISRQDMMVLTARALEKYKALKSAGDTTVLSKFKDKGEIADYAANSLATLVKEGLIAGTGDRLNPRARTTRAEAAAFLYRIYNKY